MTTSLTILPSEQLYNCDNPMHGYGCFHLDKKGKSGLTDDEQKDWDAFVRQYGDFDDLDEFDDEIADVKAEIERNQEEIAELEEDLIQLEEYRGLLEKMSKT